MIVKPSAATAIETGRITILHRLVQQPREILHPSGAHRRWTQPWTPKVRDETHDGAMEVKVREIDQFGNKFLDVKCHIVLIAAEQTTAGSITYEIARACGHRTTADWKAAWVRQHDTWCNRHETLARTLAPTADPSFWVDDTDLVSRFDQRHQNTPIWRCTFQVDPVEALRYLHRSSDELYTHNPALGLADPDGSRPAGVDKATLDRFAKDARDREAAFAADPTVQEIRRVLRITQGIERSYHDKRVMREMRTAQKAYERAERYIRDTGEGERAA